ncbi:MAG: chondroitinase-B domain-containing protein [Verrucomicrobiota bacterium JB024]|nr:chondroitinase-B domain-containing protein [Verrucomicrobiota bacterium JB024]
MTEVSSAEDLEDAVNAAAPGDMVIVTAGRYSGHLDIEGQGTRESPVTIRAERQGSVGWEGPVTLKGNYLSLEGFVFGLESSVTIAEGTGHRILRCEFNALRAGHWVRIDDEATRCEIGYCSFTHDDNSQEIKGQQVVQVRRSDASGPDHHWIHHNYFAEISRGGSSNGFETIQLHQGKVRGRGSSQTLIEYNYFERCNGEPEIISVKCSDNVIRHNVFVECQGMLTFRNGHGNTAVGNVFFGSGVAGTGGIRFQGRDQTVINNYMEGLTASAISLHDGDPDDKYERVEDATIAFNTIVNCALGLTVGLRYTSKSTEPPLRVVLANNLFACPEGSLVHSPDNDLSTWTISGNIYSGHALGIPDPGGFRYEDLLLVALPGGIQVPQQGSPAIGGAEGDFPGVVEDIFGLPRPVSGKDVGAAQVSAPLLPVSPIGVGPDAAMSAP